MTRTLRTPELLGVLVLLAILGAPRQGAAEESLAAPETAEATAGAPEASGGPSLDETLAQLGAPEASARVAAARLLGERRETGAVVRLTAMIRSDPVPEVRGWVVRALHQIGTPEALSAVTAAAREDPDERVRAMAGQLVGVAPAVPPPFAPAQPYASVPQAQAYTPMAPIRPQPAPRIPGRGLRVGGIITTSASYGLALLVGLALITAGDEPASEWEDPRNYVDWGWKLMLPIVGPAVAATTNDVGGASVIFWLWSALEIAGVTMLSIGYARRARYLRENGDPDEDEPATSRARFGLAVVPGPGGLSLSGWFF